jgi:hypothetical protein
MLKSKTDSPMSIKLMYQISKLACFLTIIFASIISLTLLTGAFSIDLPVTSYLNSETSTVEAVLRNQRMTNEDTYSNNKKDQALNLKEKIYYKHAILKQLPPVKKTIIVISSLYILYALTLCVFYFKKFMKKINDGHYFNRDTIKNIRHISYLLFSVWLIKLLSSTLLNFISFDLIHMNPMSEFHIANNFPSMAILLSAMIFWILSHVFLHGVRLEEENELTI